MKNGIRVNHTNETIEITEGYEKRARVYRSEEYKELLSARNDYSTYRIITIKNKGKSNFKGLNYDYISLYLEKHNDEEGINVFKKLVEGKPNYLEVKKWFFNRYPNLAKCTSKSDLILAS